LERRWGAPFFKTMRRQAIVLAPKVLAPRLAVRETGRIHRQQACETSGTKVAFNSGFGATLKEQHPAAAAAAG
jgi:hypothetical protein